MKEKHERKKKRRKKRDEDRKGERRVTKGEGILKRNMEERKKEERGMRAVKGQDQESRVDLKYLEKAREITRENDKIEKRHGRRLKGRNITERKMRGGKNENRNIDTRQGQERREGQK